MTASRRSSTRRMRARTATLSRPVDLPPWGDVAATAMLLIATVAVGRAAETWTPLVPVIVMTGLHHRIGHLWRPRVRLIHYLLLALPCMVLFNYWEIEPADMRWPYTGTYYSALYLLLIAVAWLYNGFENEAARRWRYPMILLGSGLALIAGAVRLEKREFLIMAVLYGAALLAILRAQMGNRISTPRSRAVLMKHVVMVCNVSLLVALFLVLYSQHSIGALRNQMIRALVPRSLGSSLGFSQDASLGDVSSHRDSDEEARIALRALSATPPGYLRGQVYRTYYDGRWRGDDGRLVKLSDRTTLPDGVHVLSGRPANYLDRPADLSIYPAARYGAHLFLPLDASAVKVNGDWLLQGCGNALRVRYVATDDGYQTWRDDAPLLDRDETAAGDDFGAFLATPGGDSALSARLRRIVVMDLREAVAAAARGESTKAMIAVRDWLHARYTYKIGIDFDERGEDPLTQWLTDGKYKHGHCELFASAGCLLLRKMGVRARYVTGFVCVEKNPWGDVYLARDRDAHAWVEYYQPGRGWLLAEFTPGSGVPGQDGAEPESGLLDYLGAKWSAFWLYLRQEGLVGIFGWLIDGVNAVLQWAIDRRWPIPLLFLAALGGYLLYRHRVAAAAEVERLFPPEIQAQREAFFELEHRLSRYGLGKEEHETLSEYHARLAAQRFPDKIDKGATLAFLTTFEHARYHPFGQADGPDASPASA